MDQFAAGVLFSAIVFFLERSGRIGLPRLCASQPFPICQQQLIAAVGPAAALIFAAYTGFKLKEQVEQGQSAVVTAEREMIRHEYDIIADMRDECSRASAIWKSTKKFTFLEKLFHQAPLGRI